MDNNWFQEMFINEAKTVLNKDGDLYTSGQVGRVDKHVFTYNGDKTGKQYIEFGKAYVVRVGPVIDPETVTEVSLVVLEGENLTEAPLPKDLISFDKAPLEELGLNGTMLIYANDAFFACVIYESTDAVTAGTYFIDNMEGDGYKFYTSCIKAETIHPIDQKFLPQSRYLLNLSSVTLAETSNEVCIAEFVTLALTNGGTFSTTVSAENCEEFYTKAQKWAGLSQEGYYVGELSDHAPQLIITDSQGMQLVPTAIYQLAEYLQQLFVSATLRLKQGDTFTIVTANCTVIFNANRSCDFFVTATAV